ncbi:MAG: ferredoxin-type protein NapF [Thiotrichaceae bacterium]|nr:ferredoxin-type protein NapF [Thiotrichaceae bacterium]
MAEPDLQRRAFFRGRISPQYNKVAIRPPWSLPIDQFIEQCDRCDECTHACPENIIFRGDAGFPEVNFAKGECTFCGKCVDSCDADAFSTKSNQSENNAWDLQVTVLSSCLSINRVTCRTCGDHCDANAIRFKLQVGGIAEPMIQNDRCTGCGACVYVCPSQSLEIKKSH